MSIDLPPGDNPEDNQPAHMVSPIRKTGTKVKVEDSIGNDAPSVGLRKHNYYNAKNASSFLALIDKWRKMQFADCNLSAAALGLSPDSLRMKLTCAKLFALEHMEMNEDIRRTVCRFEMSMTSSGIVIRLNEKEGMAEYADVLMPGKTMVDPCEEFTKWLDSNPPPRKMFVLRDLSLTAGQLEWFRQTCAQIKNDYDADVTKNQVVVIRMV